jgi:hypothetical protein
MISPALILKEYLVDALLLQTPSGATEWPVYLQALPDGDYIEDDCGCLSDGGGDKDGRLMIGTVIQHYKIQLRARSREYDDGWNKINSICDILDFISNEDVVYDSDTYRIYNVSRDVITPLGQEEETRRRWLFSVDFLVTISQIT